MSTVPYENATSGEKARAEISKILRHFGCEKIGFMDDFENHELILAFHHRGRPIQLRASAKGWAAAYLRENPFTHYKRVTLKQYEQSALQQGHIAVNSVLRDWVKGMITSVECGLFSFEIAFLPWMLSHDGRPLHERLAETDMLPKPSEAKVVALSTR
jgi:hypothetical protein